MRIVGGSLKGKRLEAPDGGQLRPTSDRARESLFNLLTQGRVAREAAGGGNPLIGARLLDGFAGTGALGIEALSRGAAEVFFMEKDAGALKLLRGNLKHCGRERQGRVVPADVANPPTAERACDIVLLDPPYNKGLGAPALLALAKAGWIGPESLTVLECDRSENLEPPEGFTLLEERRYGKAKLLFLRYGPV